MPSFTLPRVKMEISNLVPSNSVNVEGVFVGPISPIKTSKKNELFEGSYSKAIPIGSYVSGPPLASFFGKCEISETHAGIKNLK